MKTIYKHSLSLTDPHTWNVQFFRNAKVVHVEAQDSTRQYPNVCVWMEVDTEEPIVTKQFKVFGTGHQVDHSEGWHHCGTTLDGPFVWHVYEGPDL